MSLLKRIETIRAGTSTRDAAEAETPAASPDAPPPPPVRAGPTAQTLTPEAQRLVAQVPVRESFREVKFRLQARVIAELDPKLDLANQVVVRQQIEAAFSRL